ncbi:MAG: hypothetical protein AB1508_16845 [Pseudomonadota bacterium]
MHVSYGELVRVVPDAIRMLGFTYSQADDSAEAVIWTECVLSAGYELLNNASVSNEPFRKAPIILDDDGGKVVVSVDRPLFAYAARIADLAISRAAAAGISLIRVIGEAGANVTPYIAYRVSRAGYGIAVISTASQEYRAHEGRTLVVAYPGGRIVHMARGQSIPCDALSEALPKSYSNEIKRACTDDGFAGVGTDGEILIITVAKQHIRDLPIGARSLCRLEQRIDVVAQLQNAVIEGLEVPSERHAILTGLAAKIRVENFDRSRTQAG